MSTRCAFRRRSGSSTIRPTGPDGTVEVFGDRPARFLQVERDPETGAIRPVMKGGRPEYIWLCREEPEAR